MEEKKTKNNPKLIYILIFTLALVLLLTGLFDMKANAAEYEYSVHIYYDVITYKNEEEYSKSVLSEMNLTCESPMFVYLYDVLEPITGEFEVASYVVSQSPIQGSPNPYSTFVDNNNVTWYCLSPGFSGKVHSPYSRTFQCVQTGAEEVHYLNCFYTYDEFVQAFKDDTLDLYIDYDSLPIDDEMPLPTNFKINRVANSDNTGNDTYYDYITWNNTTDYAIQVEVAPIVYVYENEKMGFGYGDLIAYKDSNYLLSETLTPQTSKYTFEVFDSNNYYPEMDYIPSFMEYYRSISAEYPDGSFTDYNNYYSVGYRFRYIDLDTKKTSAYVYVVPNRKNLDSYESYNLYSDGSFSVGENVTGVTNSYTNSTLDDMLADVDKENAFKDKYETIDNEADIQEVSNWLKTVTNFISGTPSVVGSVLNFLPQPILYGLYITIFLGVIASGIAIIRALI